MADVDVLVICGAAGVGKTSTAHEVSALLGRSGIAHATVDADELDRMHPWPVPGLPAFEPARTNLAALWSTYLGLGHTRLVLCGVFADLRQELAWIADAVPRAAFTVVRLTASPQVLAQRVRRREIGSGTEDQLERSTAQSEAIAAADPGGTLVVDTTGLTVQQVADRVVGLWPAARTAGRSRHRPPDTGPAVR
ncbi:AAA family ATPase [Streptomyces sp. NPDC059637]|uniref:AAA family ATPase n=1 Tax=Streptomyces sp. NPDC059637 TaxID=3347752 RepID=UPI0036C48CFF